MGKRLSSHSSPSADPLDPLPPAATIEGRILRAARQHLFSFGYSTFTMDDLAHELGMSKKTIYVHFAGKDVIVDKIFALISDALRARLETITTDKDLSFVQKLAAMINAIGSVLSQASQPMLRDLERFAPATYAKIEALRAENVPLYFGRLIREGIACGRVRPDLDPDFATQFWLQAIRGLVQPTVLERTQLNPKQTLERAIDLFFSGLLTPAGRLDYENYTGSRKN